MADIIDRNLAIPHYVAGTSRADDITGNGRGHIFGGDGNDRINLGIVDPKVIASFDPLVPGSGVLIGYGGASRPGFGHPASVVAHAGFGGLNADGNDRIDFGQFCWAVGGSGADKYFRHGPDHVGAAPEQMAAIWFDPFEGDTFIFDHSKETKAMPHGFTVESIVSHRVDANTVRVDSLVIHAHSENAIIEGSGGTRTILHFTDDHRGTFHPFDVDWAGSSATDDVREAVFAMDGDNLL